MKKYRFTKTETRHILDIAFFAPDKLENFKALSKDDIKLIKEYVSSNQILRITELRRILGKEKKTIDK